MRSSKVFFRAFPGKTAETKPQSAGRAQPPFRARAEDRSVIRSATNSCFAPFGNVANIKLPQRVGLALRRASHSGKDGGHASLDSKFVVIGRLRFVHRLGASEKA